MSKVLSVLFFWSFDCVSYMCRTQASLSFLALTFIPTHTTSKYISWAALALSHPPLEVRIAHTHTIYNWQKNLGLYCWQPWLFIHVHKVPALRGFQSCWGWKIMLFIWMSASRTNLSRVRRQSVLLKKERVRAVAPSACSVHDKKESEYFRFCTSRGLWTLIFYLLVQILWYRHIRKFIRLHSFRYLLVFFLKIEKGEQFDLKG